MSELTLYKTDELTTQHKQGILKLWNEEYPAQLKHKDLPSLEEYFAPLDTQYHLLLLDLQNHICGWYYQFERENETWFAMIISSAYQGKGYGYKLLDKAKTETDELCGWAIDHTDYKKADGTPYHSPIPFYLKNGFQLKKDIRIKTDHLDAVKIIWKRES